MANTKLRFPHLVEKAARLYKELGSTHKVVEQKRLQREQESIRNKLGMR